MIEKLAQEIQIFQVRQQAKLLNDSLQAEALLYQDDSIYLPLSKELGQKLIAAENNCIKIKATAAPLLSSYQYDDLKVLGAMDDLAKALDTFKKLVVELKALKP